MPKLEARWSARLLVAIGLLCLSSSSSAEDDAEIDTLRAGPYVGLSVAGGFPAFDGEELFTLNTPSRGDTKEEPSIGVNARAGWRILSWAAAEIQYEWMKEFSAEARGEECARVNTHVLTGNVKLFAPHHSFHPYILGGVGTARLERVARTIPIGNRLCSPNPGESRRDSNWEFAARVGLGFDLYLTEHVLVNLEATGVHTGDETLHKNWPYVSLTAGIQYRF